MISDKKKPDTRLVLVKVRLAYADGLIKARAFEEGAPLRFGVTALLSPGHPGVDLVEAAIEAAMLARWGKKSERPKRIRGIHFDPVIKVVSDYPAIGLADCAGWSFVRASTLDQPGIINARKDPVIKEDFRAEIYSGRWAKVSVNAFCYERKTGCGVSLGLGNVQLLQHDERLGAARPLASEEFDVEELPDDDKDAEDDEDEDLSPRRPRRR